MKIYDDITQLVGNTPLVRLSKICKSLPGNIIAKAEFMNPLSSIKDRAALAMIESAEKKGQLRKGSVIVESTSGNTGISLAFIAAIKSYRIILTIPDNMSVERQRILKALGAEVVLTAAAEGMRGACEKAREILNETKNSFMPGQFENEANPDAHRKTTALEIWESTSGKIDFFVTGIGTGGTITGVGEILKKRDPNIKIIGIEPSESRVLEGGAHHPHKIEGIGAGFIPKVLNKDVIDEIIPIGAEKAKECARRLAKEEGLLVGVSSGANVAASIQVAQREENKGKNIVTILCDTGERYLSGWLFD